MAHYLITAKPKPDRLDELRENLARRAYASMRAMLPNTRVRPVTAVGQLLWAQQVRATDAATRHSLAGEAKRAGVDEIALCLRTMQRPVQVELDKHLAPPPPTVATRRASKNASELAAMSELKNWTAITLRPARRAAVLAMSPPLPGSEVMVPHCRPSTAEANTAVRWACHTGSDGSGEASQ